jgi:hypothetical protein
VDKKELPHRQPKPEPSTETPKKKSVKKSSKKRSKSPSLHSLRESMSTNCCQCCVLLGQYIREAGKLLCSCLSDSPTETKVCELFSEMLEVGMSLTSDLFHIFRRFFRFLVVYKPWCNTVFEVFGFYCHPHRISHRLNINRPTKRGKENSQSDGHCQCEKEMDDYLLACQ